MNLQARNKLRSGTLCTGVWLSSGSPVVAELAALCGLDWLLFDMEHGLTTDESLLSSLQAVRGTNTALVVRISSADRDQISRALDWGADGIMVPHVSTAELAEQCVRWMRYLPAGTRGVARSSRANHYGLRTADPIDPPPVLMVQIETPLGVQNSQKIAGVDGVDVLFVGPSDLRHSIESSPAGSLAAHLNDFDACLRQVAAVDKTTGTLLRSEGEMESLKRAGFRVLAISSDLSILKTGFVNISQMSRSSAAL